MARIASSLHVRSDSSEQVANAIERILTAQGYHRVDSATARPDAGSGDPSERTVLVTKASNGWVGVFESDLMDSLTLALAISDSLKTHAICLVLGEGNSWHYELFQSGKTLDGFDSPGATPLLAPDQKPEEMLEMPDATELAEAIASMGDQAPELLQILQSLMPPEMRQVYQRITSAKATEEDERRFSEWARELVDEASSKFGLAAASSPLVAGGSDGNGRASAKRSAENRVARLGALLPDKVCQEKTAKLLEDREAPARHLVGDFLQLLGIPRTFAPLEAEILARMAEEADQTGVFGELELAGALRFCKE